MTLRTRYALVFAALLLCPLASAESPDPKPKPKSKPSAGTRVPRAKLQPFLNAHCIRCHGPDKQEADVRFDQATWTITSNDSAQRWQDVLDQLNGGDMPPEDQPQPSRDDLAKALEALTGAIVTARNRLTDHGGEITIRRLNRREYANTIYSLFGFDIQSDQIPEDGEFESFDTVGAQQLFTSSHFEKYLELGTKIAGEAFRWNTRRKERLRTIRSQPEDKVTEKLREKLADLDNKMAMKKAGKTWQEMGFKDEGEAEIVFQQFDSRAGLPRRYLQYPKIESGVYLSDVTKWVSANKHTDIRGDYLVRIHGGAVGETDEIRRILKLSDGAGILGTLKIQGTVDAPKTVSIRMRQPMGRFQLTVRAQENIPSFATNTLRGYLPKLQGKGKQFEPWSSIWIDYLEIEGPYYPENRAWFEDLLYPGAPTGGPAAMRTDEKARELIESFAFQAFRRRTPEPSFVDGLHARFMQNRKAGLKHTEAMADVLGIVLASPAFLYLQEETSPGSRTLDNRELAIRLAYFLWSCPPDEALYDADLSDPQQLSTHVDRLLDDPRSSAFREGFISQWSDLKRFDAITVDEKEFFRFNDGLRHAARREVFEFFSALIDEDLPASNLIQSDFVTVNSALAAHYGIEGVEPTTLEFVNVKLPADSPRGGLMTQLAFLTSGSNGERSSPVIRGAMVMEKLLHDKPAPPPPNVPELSAASKTPKSNREMVKLHQQQAVCASCHKKMDVIGFGLENFDTVGAWRETEKVGRKQVAIEPGGTLPGGEAFANVQQLKSVLLQNEDLLAEELIESMLAYALGRTIEFSDSDDVLALKEKLSAQRYGIRSMIREIAMSKLFRRK